ncbi:MAG: PAS domain S-box protein [Desulfobacterales bacterium]
MKLRRILFVLSLLAFLSVSIGGSLFYYSLKKSAIQEAERQAQTQVEMLKINLAGLLSENLRPVRTLAGFSEIRNALVERSERSLESAHRLLDHFQTSLGVDVCYLMDPNGMTIASSNRKDPDSFIGHNFGFRPYFKQAMSGQTGSYLALGTTSRKRGAYYSYPVQDTDGKTPLGVVVVKASIEQIEMQVGLGPEDIILVTNPQGVIFISNRVDWRYHLLWNLSQEEITQVSASRQFGNGPWLWTGLKLVDARYVVDSDGHQYLMNQSFIETFPGWQIILLRDMASISKVVSEPLIRITGPVVLALSILVGISVFYLYRRAYHEILKRKEIQAALKESEERYRTLYNHTPAMLHSIDNQGRIISVSDYWLEVLGYRREDVIGKRLTSFFTESSRQYAEQVSFPEFFKTGFCKDIPYQFMKNGGSAIDIVLSAIAERDGNGRPMRSLAVSIDVTERIKAERALKLAKDELSRYTQGLERQVRKRTREITGILSNTPDVVSIKDPEGRYDLINGRFEEILGLSNEAVQGRTDFELFPRDVAGQFRINDLKVLNERRSLQVEERIPHRDGTVHTYLSVKFPFYDENGETSGVCQVSTDITEVKRAQDQLRRLSASIMAGQEKERSAIARELHDELGQVLTALRMESVWIAKRLEKSDPTGARRALTMCQLIDRNIEDVRGMAIRLRPGVLDDLGLVAALEWYTTDFERRTEVTCLFEYDSIPAIGDAVATAAYRITQEALTNAVRHGAPSRCEVELSVDSQTLVLTVTDNGIGFNPSGLGEAEGIGLAGMRERANLVGGELMIQSAHGDGTHVRFSVPLDGQDRIPK